MAQSTLIELADAMAEQIRDALHETTFPVQVEKGFIVTPTPPTIDIYAAPEFRVTEGAGMGDIAGAYGFTVRARVSGDIDAQQELLWQLMDDTHALCLAAAIEDEPTLGGLATATDVIGFSGVVPFGELVGCTWDVLVMRAYS